METTQKPNIGGNPTQNFASKLSQLYTQKTESRANALIPAARYGITKAQNNSTTTYPQPKWSPDFDATDYDEYSQSTFSSEEMLYADNNQWQKVRKGESNSLKNILDPLTQLFSTISLRKLVPITVVVGVLMAGFVLIKGVVGSTNGTSYASGLNSAALDIVKDEAKQELRDELKDEQTTKDMKFLASASNRFKSAPSGDVPLIDNTNELKNTQKAINDNTNLYTTIYLHKDLVTQNLDELKANGVDEKDMRATMFSLFELEKRAYDNIREVDSMLDQMDNLYDTDRGKKMELRAISNEQIVQLNQTNAEIKILIQRLDRFFVDKEK
jgi:hypothetical protein